MSDDRAGIIRLAEGYMGWLIPAGCTDWYRKSKTRSGRMRVASCEWNPFESPADAFELEAAIPEDKRIAYTRALCYATDAFMDNRGAIALHARDWKLIHATPRQRSEAALAVLGGM